MKVTKEKCKTSAMPYNACEITLTYLSDVLCVSQASSP